MVLADVIVVSDPLGEGACLNIRILVYLVIYDSG